MNRRTKKKIKKRHGYRTYKNYKSYLMRRLEACKMWMKSEMPVGVVESLTIEKGTDTEKDAVTNDAITVWNYLSVKGLSNTEIAGFRGNMILERSGKENL